MKFSKRLFFNKAIRVLLLTNSLVLVAGAMLGPIYALFVENIGGDLLDASLTGGIFALAAGITTLVAGRYADKKKKARPMVISGYFLMGVGFILFTFVNSIWFLFGVQLLIGFAEAFYSPAFDALYTRHVTKRKVGREWGAWESANYFSIAVGAVIGGLIVTYLGFNVLFISMGALCFISALYLYLFSKRML